MTTVAQTRIVRTRAGRELCVEVVGEPPRGTVIVLGGTPNTRHPLAGWIADATKHGLQLVGYDRPGYGRSTPHPGHSVADAAADVETIADALGPIPRWYCISYGVHPAVTTV